MANKYQQITNSNKAISEKIATQAELVSNKQAIYRRYITQTIGWCE
jgi:hypothetical protein